MSFSFFLFFSSSIRFSHVDDSAGHGQSLLYHYRHEHGHPVHGGVDSHAIARARHGRRSHHWSWRHFLCSFHSLSGNILQTLTPNRPRIITHPQRIVQLLTCSLVYYLWTTSFCSFRNFESNRKTSRVYRSAVFFVCLFC